jgi:hypothetical protein
VQFVRLESVVRCSIQLSYGRKNLILARFTYENTVQMQQ